MYLPQILAVPVQPVPLQRHLHRLRNGLKHPDSILSIEQVRLTEGAVVWGRRRTSTYRTYLLLFWARSDTPGHLFTCRDTQVTSPSRSTLHSSFGSNQNTSNSTIQTPKYTGTCFDSFPHKIHATALSSPSVK